MDILFKKSRIRKKPRLRRRLALQFQDLPRRLEQNKFKRKRQDQSKLHKNLTIIAANVNGIINKTASLQFNLEQLKPDIMILQETRLKRKVMN